MYVIQFADRSDKGPNLIGPFATALGAQRWVDSQGLTAEAWTALPMHVPDAL